MKTSFPSFAALARQTITLLMRNARPIRLFASLGCAAFAFVAQPAGAAVTEAWVQRYSSGQQPQSTKVACDAAGNIIVVSDVGSTTNDDLLTIKYSGVDGSVLWQRLYNGPNTAGNSWDYAAGVAVDGSGNVVVTGPSFNAIWDYGYDYYTAKYAASNGALLWERRYNGGTVVGGSDDWPQAVAVDASGNVLVTGRSANANYYMDFYTAKYAAANGALLWQRRYNGPANGPDEPSALAVDRSGNVVVTGTSGNGTNNDFYTAKYAAANGALLWEKRYNGPANRSDEARAVAVDSSGNVVVTGSSDNATSSDSYTAKYAASNGALIWEKRGLGGGAVAVDASDNVVVSGSSTVKYRADGTGVWTNSFGGFVAVDGGGNVVVTGTTNNGTSYDYYTAKYAAANGALLWEKRYNGPANGDDSVSSLAVGPNEMVAVTGSSRTALAYPSADVATVVYWENLPPVSIGTVPAGIRLRFTGVPGSSYNIERAPAVTGPWSYIASPTAPPDGLVECTDTDPLPGTAFYRTSAP